MSFPALLATAPDIPAPLWLITVLHGLTFVLHTAAMNLLVGGAFHLASGGGGRRLAAALPPLFSITVTLGVAPLLFLQLVHGERFYASSIQMGWLWIGILLVLMLAYYAAYACDGRYRRDQRPAGWLRVAPFAGLMIFSFVLAANVALSEHPEVLGGLTNPGLNLPLVETGVWLRWSHEIVCAIAFGSLLLLILAHGARRDDPERAQRLTSRGVRTAVGATLVSVLLGVGQLMTSTDHVGGALAGMGLGLGILAGLAAIGMMVLYGRGPSVGRLVGAGLLAIVALTGKTILRFAMRASRLEDVPEAPIAEHIEVGPILLFLVCFLIAVGALVWLLRLARPTPTAEAR